MSDEKLFEVRPRMEGGGSVVVEVVKTDDGATLALMSHPPDLTAYQGAHAFREPLETAFEKAYFAGYAKAVQDITQPPKQPAAPVPEPPAPAPTAAPAEPAAPVPEPPAPAPTAAPAEPAAPATEPEGKLQP